MTATLQAITDRALSQVGGYYPGSSPYGEWYDRAYGGGKGIYDSAAFCAMGLSWVFYMEGAADIFPMHAYTPSGVNAWKARGQWHEGTAGIQPGDILYLDFPGPPNEVSHVELALSTWKSGVDTVGFNTSGLVNGDQVNGRAVVRKRRTASIVGYGRPDYGDGPKTAVVAIGRNLTSRPTHEIQALVGAEQDDVYGPDTTAKVIAWQGAHGLEPDGVWGPLSDAAGFPSAAPAPAPGETKDAFIIPTMHEGSKTEFEHLWQRVLQEMGFTSVGKADGDYGPRTAQATRNFQAARGLTQDAVAGPITVSAALLTDGDHVLAEGDSGARVCLLQNIVGTTTDDSFGPATKAETQKVQRGWGINPDGVAGPDFVDHYRKAAA